MSKRADGVQASEPWKTVDRHGPPECDGEAVFIGINSAGYAACFNDYEQAGRQCLMTSAEGIETVMSDLLWWRELDRPDTSGVKEPASVVCPECGCHFSGSLDGYYAVHSEQRSADSLGKLIDALQFVVRCHDSLTPSDIQRMQAILAEVGDKQC